MRVDSDVLIWNWRGRLSAANALAEAAPFRLSAVNYMELVQGMRNRAVLKRLHTGNTKHFNLVAGLKVKAFKAS